MKTLVSGFIQYARSIFQSDKGTRYIPALYSNQSNLESLFSRIRFMGKDMTHLYARGILQHNVFNQISSIKKLKGNTSYPVDNITLEMNVEKQRKNICSYVNDMKEKSEGMLNSINLTPCKSQTHIIQRDVELYQ